MTKAPERSPGIEIATAVRLLHQGKLVAFPTETVYGLGADAFNTGAIERVFKAKGRPATNPLIVHVANVEMARIVTAGWPGGAEKLAEAFWPGPLSIVLPKHNDVPSLVTAGLDAVAVRCPDHPVALELIRTFGGPLVGPSANPSGYVSPTRPEHVRKHFTPEEVMVLDGGACRAGIESTVIDLTQPTPTILRPGVVGADAIGTVLGKMVNIATQTGDAPAQSASPGVLGPHYQPDTRVLLARTMDGIESAISTSNGAACVLCPPGVELSFPSPHRAVPMPPDARAYAAALYTALRDADDSGVALIIVAVPEITVSVPADAAVWEAILERLGRAASR